MHLRLNFRRLAFDCGLAGSLPNLRSRGAKPRVVRRLAAEFLEPRDLLTWIVVADSLDPVDLRFQEDPSSTSDDVLILSLDADRNLQYELYGSQESQSDRQFAHPSGEGPLDPQFRLPIGDIGSIRVNSAGGSDRLILDFTNGGPVPADGINFSAWEDDDENDALELAQYSAAEVDVVHAGVESGTVVMDEGPPVSFSQTESLILGGTVVDLEIVFSLVGATNREIAISNGATAGFSAIHGPTWGHTRFANPTSSLLVNSAASGGNGADAIRIEDLDAAFDADLAIHGGHDDTVTFRTGGTGLGPSSRNLTVTAHSIDVEQPLSISGNVSLDADVVCHVSGSVSAEGTIAITAGDDVFLDAAVHSAGSHLSVVAGGDVMQNADITILDTGIISVTSAGGVAMSETAGTVSVDGPITYNAVGDLVLGVVRTRGGGSIDLRTNDGALTIQDIVRVDVGGNLTLEAGGPILFQSSGRLETAGGEAVLESAVAITMSQGAILDAGGGDVYLAAERGVLLGRIVSPGAIVTVDAGQGGIADGVDPADPPDDDGADIESYAAVLRAVGSIGSRVENAASGIIVSRLDTKFDRLDAVSANGVGIFLVNEGSIVIDRAEANRADAPPGIVDITTVSSLAVTGEAQEPVVNPTEAEGANEANFLDVNQDGLTTPLDVLIVINDLNRYGSRSQEHLTAKSSRLDVNGDLMVSPQDALRIIRFLNGQATIHCQPKASIESAAPRVVDESGDPFGIPSVPPWSPCLRSAC